MRLRSATFALSCFAIGALPSWAAASEPDHVWLGTSLSVELPLRRIASVEVGAFALSGIGAGVDIYPMGRNGIMFAGRIGLIPDGEAINALVGYLGHFSTLEWRVGAGLGNLHGDYSVLGHVRQYYPVIEMSLGVRL